MLSKRFSLVVLALVVSLTLAPVISVVAQEHQSSQSDTAVSMTQSQTHETAEAAGEHSGRSAEEMAMEIGENLPLWSVIPFAGILLSIAIFPLVAPHFWHKHFPKVSAAWALIFAIPFLLVYKGAAFYEIVHIYIIDYIPFIILLWGLFTAAGGILIKGSLKGTPIVNATLILIGTFFASWIGTTGAAMVLIRPLLRSNEHRRYKVHTVVFFIFLVANIGGSLTPLGDPPLFLGFLHHVPFFWTFNLFTEFVTLAVLLLVVYFLLDSYFYKKEDPMMLAEEAEEAEVEPIRVVGLQNLIFLGGIMGAVLLSGVWKPGDVSILGVHVGIESLSRDLLIVVMGVLSLIFTSKEIREGNEFTWFPIKEVAYLFAGIFMTIIPALAILKAGENGGFGFIMEALNSPAAYFWLTGSLSSFLDNAPTYLTFMNTALGSFYAGLPEPQAVAQLISTHAIYLKAISTGAVFFGSMTYIGNAPNFMVKSIAEESGVDMPSFFGYMFKYSVIILIPAFLIITFLFF